MFVKCFSGTVEGVDARTITVEVNQSSGNGFIIVGLADNAVRESHERIKAAYQNTGFKIPYANLTVNLAPADIRKEGTGYDLAIAMGVLAVTNQIPTINLAKYIIVGEISLEGKLGAVKGALSIAVQAHAEGFEGIILPSVNAREAAVVNKIKVYGVDDLSQVVDILSDQSDIQPLKVDTRAEYFSKIDEFDVDFSDVKGQLGAKRAMEIAAAGGHNVLMIGPPGSGKSMLAARLPSIMPPMTLPEALETTKIHSVAGKMGVGQGLMSARPFRSPHHTSSDIALVGGGGMAPQPGEISLAHNGVMFLDELPEFSRHLLEVLRQPLEERKVSISRARYTVSYPANFVLVGAMNPCPCGYLTHPTKTCQCSPSAIHRYINKVSGPLMDRIDMHIEVAPVDVEAISVSKRDAERSHVVRERVVKARDIQTERFASYPTIHCNAMMPPALMDEYCKISEEGRVMLCRAIEKLRLSARAYDKILKLSRTIADLADAPDILEEHLAEAITYRSFDREGWGVNF